MKKYLALILFFTVIQLSFGQIQSGEVIYKVTPPQTLKEYADISTFKNPSLIQFTKKYYHKVKIGAPFITLTLNFNKEAAIFKRVRTLTTDNGMDLYEIAFNAGVEGDFYSNPKQDILLIKRHVYGKDWLVKTTLSQYHWKIEPGHKIIQGYKCLKATAVIKINPEEEKEFTVTAWFCPQLPFHYGPTRTAGLPGLMLGVKFENFYIHAVKVKLSKKDKRIKKFKGSKVVSPTEFYKELNRLSQLRRQGIRSRY